MTAPLWLVIAENEIGVHEEPGMISNMRILQYHDTTTLKAGSDEVPWCSSFVNWCMEKAGIEGTKSAAARSWLEWGHSIAEPVEGCIVVLSRGDSKINGHVGFFAGEKPGLIRVLGGNQKDSVCYAWYLRKAVIDYRMPDGDNKLG